MAVPIQALTLRDMLFDPHGNLVREPPPPRPRRFFFGRPAVEPTVSASTEPPPGHERKETEGVFVLRDNRAVFAPLKTGIAGERYFEVTAGAKAGDRVITGPFASVRELADGAEVEAGGNAATHRNAVGPVQ